MSLTITRRSVLAALGIAACTLPVRADPPPIIRVNKDPTCGCCTAWVEHLRRAGFTVEVTETAQMNTVKARLGVPRDLASCHTAEVAGYVVEGHVPAAEVRRLLAERPKAIGLAVPGMPVGSPGMEVSGREPDFYEVILFGAEGRSSFARYVGDERQV
jgi:hypothetical protein